MAKATIKREGIIEPTSIGEKRYLTENQIAVVTELVMLINPEALVDLLPESIEEETRRYERALQSHRRKVPTDETRDAEQILNAADSLERGLAGEITRRTVRRWFESAPFDLSNEQFEELVPRLRHAGERALARAQPRRGVKPQHPALEGLPSFSTPFSLRVLACDSRSVGSSRTNATRSLTCWPSTSTTRNRSPAAA
jgi:hypothetical protein